ncbi:MAG: YeeE/YedE family protein [Treponema sp.]|nr:YeeE/YedE family protein [Treponema sp.]
MSKKNLQIGFGLFILIASIGIAFYAQKQNINGAFIWLIGLALGYVLQRSRFCFTAAIRDPFLTGGTALTKALVIALALSSVLYFALQVKAVGWDLKGEGKLIGNIANLGWHTVVGGFLFGLGAVIAGGCASGTLMRMGEGFLQQWITIIFFIAGSVIGGPVLNLFNASKNEKPIHIPTAFGSWIPALILQFGLLFVIYIVADVWGKKKAQG